MSCEKDFMMFMRNWVKLYLVSLKNPLNLGLYFVIITFFYFLFFIFFYLIWLVIISPGV